MHKLLQLKLQGKLMKGNYLDIPIVWFHAFALVKVKQYRGIPEKRMV